MIERYIRNNRLNIIVKAGSSKNKIMGYDDARDAVKVEIKAPAKENKANIEIVKYFSKILSSEVRILRGKTSKRKVLEIR